MVKPIRLQDEPDRLLLWVLRDELGLTGTKFGCGIGHVRILYGASGWNPHTSLLTMLSAVQDKEVRTIEGLAEMDTNGEIILHPVQQAFLDEQVPQCSWCMSGQMMTAAALLEQNPQPNADEIRQAMDAVYCRCGTYHRIRKAVERAAELALNPGVQ